MTLDGHSFTVGTRTDKHFVGNPIRFRAECECGWVGEYRRTEDSARSDGFAHQGMIKPEPEWEDAA